MPFDVWCIKCSSMIAKGVRFNAEKRYISNYLTSKIWSFSMKHHCGCRIEIHTNPKENEYVIVEGVKKKMV